VISLMMRPDLDPRAYGFPASAVMGIEILSEDEAERYHRSAWPPGPWDQEPFDYVSWQASGLECLLVRNRYGGWCGYVGVPSTHPWYKVGYSECVHGHKAPPQRQLVREYRRKRETARKRSERDMWNNLAQLTAAHYHPRARCAGDHSPEAILNAHGGITYSDLETSEDCCIRRPEVSVDPVYFYGFDCGHYMDVLPGMLAMNKDMRKRLVRDPSAKDLFQDDLHFDPVTNAMPDGSTYRTYQYAMGEVMELAGQLQAAGAVPWRKAYVPSKPPLGQRMRAKRETLYAKD
jgi:hypothetical protein